jgi:hypothetical protein
MSQNMEPVTCTFTVHPKTWKTIVDGATYYRMGLEEFILLGGYRLATSILPELLPERKMGHDSVLPGIASTYQLQVHRLQTVYGPADAVSLTSGCNICMVSMNETKGI